MTDSLLHEELSKLTALEAAERLLGSEIVRVLHGIELKGRVVETEAYDESDPSSHSFRGKTKRNSVMFGPAGVAYVYFTYGMHYCMNVVCGPEGFGSGVLIRALEPLSGLELMSENRGNLGVLNLLNGPARLSKSLKIDLSLNGHDLSLPPLMLRLRKPLTKTEINWSGRIGIREEPDKILLWRATIKNSKYLSRPL